MQHYCHRVHLTTNRTQHRLLRTMTTITIADYRLWPNRARHQVAVARRCGCPKTNWHGCASSTSKRCAWTKNRRHTSQHRNCHCKHSDIKRRYIIVQIIRSIYRRWWWPAPMSTPICSQQPSDDFLNCIRAYDDSQRRIRLVIIFHLNKLLMVCVRIGSHSHTRA